MKHIAVLTENLLSASQFFGTITEARCHCLNSFASASALIKWLRNDIKGGTHAIIYVLITLLVSSVGFNRAEGVGHICRAGGYKSIRGGRLRGDQSGSSPRCVFRLWPAAV